MEIYKVGGAVRDGLLDRPIKDCDWVVVGATTKQMLEHGYRQVGKEFPVFLHPQTGEEYALARTERKVAPGYKGFDVNASPNVSLEQDLERRDLTINAMAENADGTLIDPYRGQADLQLEVLRHVSPAFAEDPVRILRVARFAARFGYRVADETQQLMRTMVASGEAEALVPERVWAEVQKALSESQPRLFFEVLRDCGALAVLFPELDRLFGVPQPKQYHPEIDTGLHTLMVLDQATRLSPDPMVRFAALVHDLGKGTTPASEWPSHRGHEARGVDLVNGLCERYRVPNHYRELAVLVARYHLRCHRVDQLKPATLLNTLQAVDAFRRPSRFQQFLLACQADALGRAGLEQRPYPQATMFWSAYQAAKAIDARQLLSRGLQGDAIAKELEHLRIRAIANTRGSRNST